jgi:hypothetical protein
MLPSEARKKQVRITRYIFENEYSFLTKKAYKIFLNAKDSFKEVNFLYSLMVLEVSRQAYARI